MATSRFGAFDIGKIDLDVLLGENDFQFQTASLAVTTIHLAALVRRMGAVLWEQMI